MEDNMTLWNKLATTDKKYVKPITGGKLEKLGYSQIDPTYRFMQLTQVLGACGQGWSYRVVRSEWTPVGQDVLHSVEVAFKWKMEDGNWSEEFSGMGSTFVSKQGDETAKSSLTDALTNAAVKIGQIADILLGKYDGSKYNNPQPQPQPTELQKLQVTAAMDFLSSNKAAEDYYCKGFKVANMDALTLPQRLGIYTDLVKNNKIQQIKQ